MLFFITIYIIIINLFRPQNRASILRIEKIV
jgi:hypothetical protein